MRREEEMTPPVGLVALDFDGTLRSPDGRLGLDDIAALREAGAGGVVRALVTGRSMASLQSVIPENLAAQLDYLLVASGAACWGAKDRVWLEVHNFEDEQAGRVEQVLSEARLDFSRHGPVPDNHHFAIKRLSGLDNPDMDRMEALARKRAWLCDGPEKQLKRVGQFIAVLPINGHEAHLDLRECLPDCSVIRATSPIDHASTWVEIFPAQVSKAAACARLCARLGLKSEQVVAVGNDHNDEDMLDWAGKGFVVAGAPAELRARFEIVAACDAGGVAEALRRCFP
ncbi:MAG: HAD family phosphatase [Deltaproteobacteria bacterium]|nr:HAD family phosphatase [Deltaproteobacteria bacterium]